jgi:alpha-2-macroglobulin
LSDGGIAGRRRIDRKQAERAAVAIGVMVILAAILGPTALNTHPSASFPDATQVAAQPSTSHGPGDTTTPEPQPWADLEVPPFELAAVLQPSDLDRLGIGAQTTFTVRSLTSTPALELAKGLHVDPPFDFAVAPGTSPNEAIVKPSSPLVAGLHYRFRLDAPDGALAGAWAFTTRAPLHVVSTLPGDRTTGVPTNTGIEVEFDQDGTLGLADHFSIKPAVKGRFEQHDRTWAFLPDTALAPATIYSVTVQAGVGLGGSAETLPADVSFRFETAAAVSQVGRAAFRRAMFEARPGQPLVLPMGFASFDQEGDLPDSVTVDIHSLSGFGAVLDAAIALAGPNAWATSSPDAVVDTSGLTRVARVKGTFVDSNGGRLLRLPFEPNAGSYVLTAVQAGPSQQMLLQVTNLAAYALTARESTVVWVNDLSTGGAVRNAGVSIARGASLGTTDAAGVLRTSTPAALADDVSTTAPPETGFLAIRAPDGRSLVVPVGLPTRWLGDGYDGYGDGEPEDGPNWWLVLRTDRSAYRQTDTVNVYGMIRARSDRSVPDTVELRLRPSEGRPEAPILRVHAKPTERGVFTGAIHLDDLPRGDYFVDLYVGAKRISSLWINVAEIRKPAFRIEVQTDRHVYVLGQQVGISAVASFYDGTAVPGMDLRFSGFDHGATATSGSVGEATAKLRAASSYLPEGWWIDFVGVAPAHPEEGQISGQSEVVLLPARTWLTGAGTVVGGRVVASGTLTWADIKGMEAKLDAGRGLDENRDGPGRPIADGKIRVEVIHLVPVKSLIGNQYDFIEKRVVPVYQYETREVSLGTSTLTSASDGTFRLSVAAPVATDDYEVRLSAADPEGRHFKRTVYASAPVNPAKASPRPYLERQVSCGYYPDNPVALDKPFTVSMHEGDGRVASGGRFLFLVTERGSVETTVQDSATFSRVLRDADLPGFTVRAVWLSDNGYAVDDARAVVDPGSKRLKIKLTPDQAHYRPGQPVSISVTTTNPSGKPVAADVVIQGVDEKLFTQGLASDADPVPELMSGQSAGFLQAYTTHDVPYIDEGGCGSAGGGREDFRDVVTFQRITTGPDGRGTIHFKLSDDLTSWHVTANAFSRALDAGIASVQIPVGLPFFVDAVLAPEYLVGEAPVLRVRAFGDALAAGTPVTFVVEAPTLGLNPTTVHGLAFQPIRVPLPKLVAGDHRIRVTGKASRSGKAYDDALIRTIHVTSSRLAGIETSYDVLDDGYSPKGGDGLTTYTITDAGRGRLVSLLQNLAWTSSARFDRLAAADAARRLLIAEFGFAPADLPGTGFDASPYQQAGVALLPYSSTDLFLSARAALAVPNLLNTGSLAESLRSWADEGQATPERRIVALAGLAGLSQDVLEELRAYDATSLTVREQLWLALGLAAAGDESASRDIERRLLETAGQRLGPWVRLSTGTTLDDTLEASGLLLLLAGRLGDALANDVSRYLADVGSNERIFPLEQLAYATGMLDRLSRDPGRFAWTIDGGRHEVKLPPGGGYTLVLTSRQRASLKLERLEGQLAVVTTWTASDVQLPQSSTISVRRTVTPGADAPDDRLVHVQLEVTFGAQAAPGCYRLVDLTPSGLTAVATTAAWPDEEQPTSANSPYSVEGQRVEWCAGPADRSHVYEYAARVVSPGSYRWEPAILQFELSPGIGASTPESAYAIR